jgi:hypothetical protein
MRQVRARILLVAGMASSLLAGLAVADTGGAATPDTATDTSVATTPDAVADTSVATTPEAAAVEILPPDELWGEATRGEWDARSWQWFLSLPPDFDASGRRCGLGQFGPVFFLPGSEAPEFTCVIAEGTAIFVKLAGVECSTIEPEPYFGRTEDELRACAIDSLGGEVLDFQARINGQDVADLDTYQSVSPLFTITFAEGNRFDMPPGVGQSVAAAYSFIIAPPPPGEYEIVTTTRFGARTVYAHRQPHRRSTPGGRAIDDLEARARTAVTSQVPTPSTSRTSCTPRRVCARRRLPLAGAPTQSSGSGIRSAATSAKPTSPPFDGGNGNV